MKARHAVVAAFARSVALGGALAVLVLAGAPALASANCPNAGKPGVSVLPDCRAWEMVSPSAKDGGDVMTLPGRIRAAADGSAVQFPSLVGFGDIAGMGVTGDYLAQRSTDPTPGNSGWATHSLIPPQDAVPYAFTLFFDPRYVGEFSPDLNKGVFFTSTPLTDAPNVAEAGKLYLRDDLRAPGLGSYQLLTDSTTPVPLSFPPAFAGATPDLGHVIIESPEGLNTDTTSGNVYEFDHGTLRLASVLPNGEAGSNAVAGSGIELGTKVTSRPISANGSRITFTQGGNLYARINGRSTVQLNASERAVPESPGSATYWDSSTDGSRVFFTTGESLTEDATGVAKLYMWKHQDSDEQQSVAVDATGGTFTLTFNEATTAPIASDASAAKVREELEALVTVKPGNVTVSGGPGGAGAGTPYLVTFSGDFAGANVAQMSADGSSLTGGAGTAVVSTTQPVENLTQLNVDLPGELSSDAVGVLGTSDDGRYAYFLATSQLVAGAPALGTKRGLYLWHEGSITYIGTYPSSSETTFVLGNSAISYGMKQSQVTPDGRYLFFPSTSGEDLLSVRGGTDYDHTCPAKDFGCQEVYLYSADSDQLVCVSCKPDGGTATGDAFARSLHANVGKASLGSHLGRSLSDDGRYAFFTSPDKLVPQDTNGQLDAYVYDSVGGALHLLSSGESSAPSFFFEATADGRNAFFGTREQLSGWDVDRAFDIYDARVDGGFPEPPAPPPSCQGDACQPAPRPLNDPTPSSASFSGSGNVSGRAAGSRRCPKGKRRVKSGGRSRCVKKPSKRHAKNNREALR